MLEFSYIGPNCKTYRDEIIRDLMSAAFSNECELERLYARATAAKFDFLLVNKESCEYWHGVDERLK